MESLSERLAIRVTMMKMRMKIINPQRSADYPRTRVGAASFILAPPIRLDSFQRVMSYTESLYADEHT
jgi:hypothetical protein